MKRFIPIDPQPPATTRDVFYDDECDRWCYSDLPNGMNDPNAKMTKYSYSSPGQPFVYQAILRDGVWMFEVGQEPSVPVAIP